MNERALRTILTLAAAACVAVLVHVASILLMPRLAPRDAFARLALPLAVGETHALPPASSPQSPVPFRDPLVASATCRYDLDRGPMRIKADVTSGAMIAMSFHGRVGVPFYGLTDRASNAGTIDVVLMTPQQRAKAEAADEEDAPLENVRVTAPDPQGFVEFDALAGVGGLPEAERQLRSVRCALDRRP